MGKQEDYLKRFKTLPPQEQKRHIAVALLYLLKLLCEKRQAECDRVDGKLLADVDI